MKKLIISLFILGLSFTSFAGITVISDLDDTLKITNSGDEIDGALNAAFRSDVFVGTTEFWMGLESYTNEQHILSASPTVLRLKIQTTLKKHQIDYTSIILKNYLVKEDKLTYKIRMILEVMKTNNDDFIFMGDDVGMDPEVYDYFAKNYPERVLAIYIRPIQNRNLPKSSQVIFTNFDLALSEYESGRMSASWTDEVGMRVLSSAKLNHIIPEFAHCPKSDSPWKKQYRSDYGEMAKSIAQKLVSYCQLRSNLTR